MGEKFSSPPPIGGLTKHPYIILDRITESQTLEVDNKTRVIRYNQIERMCAVSPCRARMLPFHRDRPPADWAASLSILEYIT